MSASSKTVLVVGATGATGKHVVQMLLDQGHSVRVIARSADRMKSLLKSGDYQDKLAITEASLLDMSDEELAAQVKDCDAIVSCLGHNMTFKGLFGHPRRLVTDAVKKLTALMNPKTTRFILMGSDGVSHPNGTTDDQRAFMDRMVLGLIRFLVPPQRDNEEAAAYLYQQQKAFAWSVVRPTDLIDGEVSKYDIFTKPQGSLFGSGTATRANVAAFMTELATCDAKAFEKYNHDYPVLYDAPKET